MHQKAMIQTKCTESQSASLPQMQRCERAVPKVLAEAEEVVGQGMVAKAVVKMVKGKV